MEFHLDYFLSSLGQLDYYSDSKTKTELMNTFLYLPQLQQLLHLHHYHYQCHYEHHLFLEPQLFLPPFFVCISAISPEFRLRKGIFQNELRIYYIGKGNFVVIFSW